MGGRSKRKRAVWALFFAAFAALVGAVAAPSAAASFESAESVAGDVYDIGGELDGLRDAVPSDILDLLPDGFFSSDVGELSDAVSRAASGEGLIRAALRAWEGGIGDAVRLFGLLLSVTMAAALLGATAEGTAGGGMLPALRLIIDIAAALAVTAAQYSQFEAVEAYFERQRLIMASLLPLMGVLWGMGGNSGGAVVGNSAVLLWLEIIGLLATSCLIPAAAVMTAVSVAGTILSDVRTSGLSAAIGRAVAGVLGLAAFLLGAALGAQSVIAGAADRMSFRTAKYFAGSYIPVVGSTVGDSLRTLAASVELLRSTVGAAGIVLLILLLLPTVISLLLSRTAFSFASGVAELLGVDALARFFKDTASVFGLLLAAAIISALVFVFAMTVFAITSAAVA